MPRKTSQSSKKESTGSKNEGGEMEVLKSGDSDPKDSKTKNTENDGFVISEIFDESTESEDDNCSGMKSIGNNDHVIPKVLGEDDNLIDVKSIGDDNHLMPEIFNKSKDVKSQEADLNIKNDDEPDILYKKQKLIRSVVTIENIKDDSVPETLESNFKCIFLCKFCKKLTKTGLKCDKCDTKLSLKIKKLVLDLL